MSTDILGLGACIVDRLIRIEENFLHHVPGEKGGQELIELALQKHLLALSDTTPAIVPGGSCANVIRSCARLGLDCVFAGTVGNDELGQSYVQKLEDCGVSTFIRPSTAHTGQCLCLVTPDGQRTMRTFLGAACDLSSTLLNEIESVSPRFFHLEGYTTYYGLLLEEACIFAHRKNAKVSLDLSSFEVVRQNKDRLLRLLETSVDIVFCNADECHELFELQPEKACVALGELVDIAIVTCGPDGAFAKTKESFIHSPSKTKNVIDTTGAGDLFAAGVLYGLCRGASLEQSLSFANACSAAVIGTLGVELSDTAWSDLQRQALCISPTSAPSVKKFSK